MRARRFVAWLEDVSAGDPASVALAVPLGLALVALIALSVRPARADRHPTPRAAKSSAGPPTPRPPRRASKTGENHHPGRPIRSSPGGLR